MLSLAYKQEGPLIQCYTSVSEIKDSIMDLETITNMATMKMLKTFQVSCKQKKVFHCLLANVGEYFLNQLAHQ